MTTQQITIFLESARQLNFTAAAEHLFLTQPTLSRQISLLENELNVKLFNRVNNHVTITPAGELLHRELTDIEARLDQLHFDVASINCGFTGSLRLAVSRELPLPTIFKTALGIFCAKYPEIELVLHRLDAGTIFQNLYNCTLDIGFNSRHNDDIDIYASKLDILKYSKETECLAIRAEYAVGLGSYVTLEQCAEIIRKHPLYMVSITSFNNYMKSYENDAYFLLSQKSMSTPQRLFEQLDEGQRAKNYRFTQNIESVFMAVECGLGCTFTSTDSKLSKCEDIVLLPIVYPEGTQSEPVEPVVLYNSNNSNPPAGNFLDIIRSLLVS